MTVGDKPQPSDEFTRVKLVGVDVMTVLAEPARLTDVASWHEHIPFAFFITQLLAPRAVVELGTHKGDSYCAFLQAASQLKPLPRCTAIDTWEGDAESGRYGPEVLQELRAYHDPRFGHFSTLLVSRFEDAISQFDDEGIDLLHIDGCHTYTAVRRDFEMWLPKMSPQGLVLLHDTEVRREPFGVWRLWQELADQLPGFSFSHGYGLGLLAVGSDPPPRLLAFLREARSQDSLIHPFFCAAGQRVVALGEERRSAAMTEHFRGLLAQAETSQAEMQRALGEVTEGLSTARRELSTARRDLATTEDSLVAVRELLADAERSAVRYKDALENVERSLSWRITTPLRFLRRMMGRIISR